MLLVGCEQNSDMNLINTSKIIEKLDHLKSRQKFEGGESVFYPGAPSEEIRVIAQSAINELISNLIAAPEEELNHEYVFSKFQEAASAFQSMDSEELERGLEYMEEIMEIYGIESSNGLLNNLRYGFDPEQ